MDWNDPDLEAFESNLCWILWAWELDKTAALVSNPFQNTPDPQLVSILSRDDA